MRRCRYWGITQNTCVHPNNIKKPPPIETVKEFEIEAKKSYPKIIRWKKKGCVGCNTVEEGSVLAEIAGAA